MTVPVVKVKKANRCCRLLMSKVGIVMAGLSCLILLQTTHMPMGISSSPKISGMGRIAKPMMPM